ncbi:hypothetical protein BGZ46_009481 [Entomortierella lignicola]|nr:hypothetical protein BGZ46_009481 [Entomortierella lignicola]
MPQLPSPTSSPSSTSESAFSTNSTIEPITPVTSLNSEPEQEEHSSASHSIKDDTDSTKAIEQTQRQLQEQTQEDFQNLSREEELKENYEAQEEIDSIRPQIEHEPAENVTLGNLTESVGKTTTSMGRLENDHIPTISSWDVASKHVATVALQCLSKDKDMELSYVAILSAITVLQSKQDQIPEQDDLYEQNRHIQEARDDVAKEYSQIMKIMCRSVIADGLSKEVLRQGIMSSEALFSQLYGSIQQAGYTLEDYAHLSMAQYWIERKNIEEAQDCLSRIDSARWTGPVYREAITCLLFSKPRHLQEAESMLQKYIQYDRITNDTNGESKIRTWFKLRLDASRWEEIKTQYERRRTRLIDGPSITERAVYSGSTLTPEALQQHQQEQQFPQRQFKHERSKSTTSSLSSSSHRLSPSSSHQRISSSNQRTPPVATSWPSGASANLNSDPPAATPAPATAPMKGALSFLSSLKFTKNTEANNSMNTSSALPSRLNVNHHLTVLDNGMLEECINYREFEFGWKQIYEKMGSALEDGETTKIAMRLCRQAFLGHSGLDPNHVGSPNLVNGDVYFSDSLDEPEQSKRSSAHLNQDLEIWEARAWAIYNKVKTNPHSLPSNKSSSSAHSHSTTTNAQTAKLSDPLDNSGMTPMAMFLHDILTIAVHSPEISSRYLKAFKIYSAIRTESQNQNLLRDPLLMTCMIKAIYDAAQAVVYNPDQKLPANPEKNERALKHHRSSSSLSLNRSQPMTLGPLMDLAFEVYADMRNVGPIRHLPSLITLTPNSPTGGKSKMLSGGVSTIQTSTLSESEPTSAFTFSPRTSFSTSIISVFQELNPTLKPNSQARRLPTDIYLALLHLCILCILRIETPESSNPSQTVEIIMTDKVVKTIMTDMTSSSGRQLHYVDHHLAAALQQYHDTRKTCCFDIEGKKERKEGYNYRNWMYQPDDAVKKYNTTISQSLNNEAPSAEESNTERLENLEEPPILTDGVEQKESETCNDGLYWDLWSKEDTELRDIRFTKAKASILWEHIMQTLL